MTKGTKNYFRHIFSMSQDPGLVQMIRIGGVSYYGKWCLLLELFGAQEIQGSRGGEYEFHKQTLRNHLRCSEHSLNTFLAHAEHSLSIRLTVAEHSIKFSYPNMLKYLGSYDSSGPNKIKGNKIKGNKIKDEICCPTSSDSVLVKRKVNEINQEKKDLIKKVVDYLNQKTASSYKPETPNTEKLISGRISEGRTLEDFQKVIDTKYQDWWHEEKMRKFIRPSTLFTPQHFDEYLNQPYKKSWQEELLEEERKKNGNV